MSSKAESGGAWLEIGRVRSAHTARREARIDPRPGMDHEFADRAWLWVRHGPAPVRLKVESMRPMGEGFRAVFAAGVPRELVGGLRGCAVLIPAEAARPRGRAPWRVADLAGLAVLDGAGAPVGEVARVYETAADGAFEVRKPDGGRFLLPAIPEVVAALDLEAGTLTLGDIAPHVVDDAD